MTAFLEAFVRDVRAQDRSPHTVSAYESDVRGFFAWLTERLGKAVPPIEVTTFDVQRYRDHLVDLGRKPSTVNRKLAALRVFFDWATQQEHASTNPARDFGYKKSTCSVKSRKTPSFTDYFSAVKGLTLCQSLCT